MGLSTSLHHHTLKHAKHDKTGKRNLHLEQNQAAHGIVKSGEKEILSTTE
jgi:hypothetical protein